ncbi:unnamed protein product [Amoebophrya sp. A120]|nr:unnamed protein product [Amoebophrya sp. A120]|eukprot:GSA120T00025581001.1
MKIRLLRSFMPNNIHPKCLHSARNNAESACSSSV